MQLKRHRYLIVLLAIWAAVQAYLLFANGIKTDGEAVKIINEANNFLTTGKFSSASYYMYLSEIILVIIKIKLGAGFGMIIAVQLLLNLFALLYLYEFMVSFYTSRKLALAGCMLLLLCFPYQLYNTFIYTESVFFSLTIIYSCYLLKVKAFSLQRILVLAALLILLCITRPSGIFILGATIIYLFFFLSKKIRPVPKLFFFLFLISVGIFVLNFAMGIGGNIDMILPFKEEHIICDVPTIAYKANIDTLENSNSLYGLFYYISHNFAQFSRLALAKSKMFFGLTRSFYSLPHNLFLQFYFYSFYALITAALLKFRRSLPVAFIYFLTMTIIFWLSVVFSCDEWHNRFFLTLTPFLIIPALYIFKEIKFFKAGGSSDH